jgi:uncharacterized membrane protein YhaH (DUF805 family)
MDYKWLLFQFDGRLNRASYWLSALVVPCGAFVAAIPFLLGAAMLGGAGSRGFAFDTQDLFRLIDPASLRPGLQTLRNADPGTLLSLLYRAIFSSLALWCYAATSIKRLHDRNKSGWWTIPFFVAPGLYHQFSQRLGESTGVLALGLVLFAVGAWGFLEVALLRGTCGPNRFGPDTLAPVDTRASWDQQSELEFVPHGAGSPSGPHVMRGHD